MENSVSLRAFNGGFEAATIETMLWLNPSFRSADNYEYEPIIIIGVSFTNQKLTISGGGFGLSGVTVMINGQNVGSRIVSRSDNSITLKGSKKKLNLLRGPNRITASVDGTISNTFVLNLIN